MSSIDQLRKEQASQSQSPDSSPELPLQSRMLEPVLSNGFQPLRSGDRVQILPAFRDPDDDVFERVVVEAPTDCSRVKIRTLIPGFLICPVEWIEAAKLERPG